jgi:MFS family permease
MGGLQAILSLAMILGPATAGLAFDHLGIPAPYLIGGALIILALIVSAADLLPGRSTGVVQRVKISGQAQAGKEEEHSLYERLH